MQMERMTYVDLLHLIHQHHLDNSIQWYINLMSALTILPTIGGSIVSIAVVVLWNVLVLRQHGRRRRYVRHLVDQRYQMIRIRGDYIVEREGLVHLTMRLTG